MPIVLKSGDLNLLETSGPVQACNGDRIPVGVRDFSTPVQTCLGGPSSLLYKVHRVSFPGVKRPERGVDHPTAEVKERVELCHSSPSGRSWPVKDDLHLCQYAG